MRAITFDGYGEPSVMKLTEAPSPKLFAEGVRIAVEATAVNRADTMQRQGLYPPPAGASSILGLECAGTVIEVGEGAGAVQPGDKVMALLSGGGYASEVVAHHGCVMAVPPKFSMAHAAAFCEAALTAYLNIFQLGGAESGDTVLVQGGGSGVGTAAIKLGVEANVRMFVTAGSDAKCARCKSLGAEEAINYRNESFVERVRAATADGVDLILDCIGGTYLADHVQALAPEGRMLVIAAMGGRRGELDMGLLLRRRLSITGSTLRARSDAFKAKLVERFLLQFGEALHDGRLQPEIHQTFPLAEAAAAHTLLQQSGHFGKLVLQVGD